MYVWGGGGCMVNIYSTLIVQLADMYYCIWLKINIEFWIQITVKCPCLKHEKQRNEIELYTNCVSMTVRELLLAAADIRADTENTEYIQIQLYICEKYYSYSYTFIYVKKPYDYSHTCISE